VDGRVKPGRDGRGSEASRRQPTHSYRYKSIVRPGSNSSGPIINAKRSRKKDPSPITQLCANRSSNAHAAGAPFASGSENLGRSSYAEKEGLIRELSVWRHA
jgi:hypothetical protein